jgi:hypothetical protein
MPTKQATRSRHPEWAQPRNLSDKGLKMANEDAGTPATATQQQIEPPPAPPQAAPATAEPQPEAQPVLAAPVADDVDAIELKFAQEAANAEKAAADAKQQPGAVPEEKPSAIAPAAESQPVMIPKPRLDEVLAENRKLSEELALANGKIAGLSMAGGAEQPAAAPGKGGQQPSAPAPVPAIEQQIAAYEAEKIKLAEKVDEGEMTMAAERRQSVELDNKIFALREQQIAERLRPAASIPSIADKAYVDHQTSVLSEAHPFVDLLSDEQYEDVKAVALSRLGSDWQRKAASPMKQLELRQAVAEASSRIGPGLLGMTREQAQQARVKETAKAAGQTQPAKAKPGDLSLEAKARAAKIALAGSLPPDTSRITGSMVGGDVPTAAAIEAMTDEQIMALPKQQREAIMTAG